jgi:deoxyribose-phosphate aldolase
LPERIAEIRSSVESGAQEIDVVITRAHVFMRRWQKPTTKSWPSKTPAAPRI